MRLAGWKKQDPRCMPMTGGLVAGVAGRRSDTLRLSGRWLTLRCQVKLVQPH
jgi:hypothetical protein